MKDPVLDAYAALGAAVQDVRGALPGLGVLADGDLVEVLRTHHRVLARPQAIGLELLGEANRRDLPHRQGATSPAAWLSGLLRMFPHAAADQVRTAGALQAVCPATKAALAEGEIAYEQASAIGRTLTDLPAGATAEQTAQAEEYLLERAPTANALELARLHKRVDALVDPDAPLRREQVAKTRRSASFHDNHDGTQTLRWTDTDERIAKLKAALDPLSAPTPAADGTRDERTPAQRRADGMADLTDRFLAFGDPAPRPRAPRPRGRHHRRARPARRHRVRHHRHPGRPSPPKPSPASPATH